MTPASLIGEDVQTLYSSETGIKIPAIHRRGMIFTAWIPAPEEIAQLQAGGMVWLVQRGPYVPEMTMIVGRDGEVVPAVSPVERMREKDFDKAAESFKDEKARTLALARRIEMGIYVAGALLVVFGLGIFFKQVFF